MTDYLPSISSKIIDNYTRNMTIRAFGEMKPEWNIHPPPPFNSNFPVVSDNFISSLKEGCITSCPSLHSFTGEKEISLLDGTRLTIDAVIFCTGYEVDFSIMPDHDPTRNTPTSKDPSLQSKLLSGPLARLYQNIFDPSHSDSIAWLCYWSVQVPAIPIADLLTMALAQIWKGKPTLPSPAAMNRTIDAHHAWVLRLATDGTMANLQQEGPWLRFLHDAAGTGCNENLGYGLRGWIFWATEPRFCNLLMTGVDSPHAWRLFEGSGRRRWDGAREAVWKANRDARRFFDGDKKRV
jgi:dimethylaniline monooxygenase (N-oxide forming)